MKYFIIFSFLITHDLRELKAYWQAEVIRREKFSWIKLLSRAKNHRRNFLLWWRLANEMFIHGNHRQRKVAKKINRRLRETFSAEIELGATIGKNLHIPHHAGIVISHTVVIGENFVVKQNTTIGKRRLYEEGTIRIGKNVDVGANCCIIGNDLTIGDNVTIGAMSFVIEDVPADSVYFTKKESVILPQKKLS